MCKVMEELWQDASKNTTIKFVEQMLLDKAPLEQIIKYTGMSSDDIIALQKTF